MRKVTFSIIIPCYNVQNTIEPCIKSVLNQSIDKETFEVILVDDGSTDSTSSKIMEFANHPNVLIQSLENNRGLSVARNTGISVSNGSILCFLDSDMTVGSTWLEIFRNRFEDKSIVGVVGDCRLPADVKPNKLDHYFYSSIRGARQFSKEAILGFQWFLFNNTALRRFVIEKVGLFNEDYVSYGGEDTELAIRIWESFPNGLRTSANAFSEHHHQRSLKDFLQTMEYYGETNFPRLINAFPKYKKQLGGDWINTMKGYLFFNPIIGILVPILDRFINSYLLVRYQVIYSVIKGARNSNK